MTPQDPFYRKINIYLEKGVKSREHLQTCINKIYLLLNDAALKGARTGPADRLLYI